MSKKRESLADKIAGVLSAAPVSFDPEEDVNEETTAKVTEYEEEENDEDELLLSKFRKQNIDLLEDVDNRYAGKKGSRKDLKDSSDEDEEVDNSESDNEDSIEEIDEEAASESNEEEDDSYDEEDSDDQEGFDITEGEEDNFKHMKDINVSQQMNKGLCVRNQLNLWENLLEMRIQLQKCLITSNKMPQHQSFKEIKANTDEFANKANETKKILSGVLDNMLHLQNTFLKKYPETKKLLKNKIPEEKKEESDEEILSDTENESNEDDDFKGSPKKKRKLSDYESELTKFHNTYKPYRNTVIQKWNEKTQMAIGKNSTGHSVLNQIEHNLCDRSRLIKRTQLKRSEYNIVGVTSEVPQQIEEDLSRVAEEYNTEIFDDDDFYHQLLRELIEVKSADLTDPVQLGRQWIQLQNLRSKMKRKIDTKATKGRKIRYAIHTKLVNFMAPIDENNYTEEAKTELYNSLFGKSQRVQAV